MDWGLGHTTRCIPLAQKYHHDGHTVFFAGNATQIKLFKSACPFVATLHLSGYNIKYAKSKQHFLQKLLLQSPKFRNTIAREKKWLKQQMCIHKFDAIISDSRFGLYHPDAKCIIITHQLQIQTGKRFTDYLAKCINKKLLSQFDACWVVDNESKPLAGVLSANISSKLNIQYIGWLSQFQNMTTAGQHPLNQQPYTLVIISGPEPTRTQLEEILLQQMTAATNKTFVVVGGNVNKNIPPKLLPNHIKYVALSDAPTLYNYLSHCEYVISRTGYSTIMDLIFLKKPAVLIPTPGQTEQEYLAAHLAKHYKLEYVSQSSVNIALHQPQHIQQEFHSQIPALF